MVIPRYFTPRPGVASKEAGGGILYAIDTFALQTGPTGTEWLVGIDNAGKFDVQRLDPFDALPAEVRSALAFHEVSYGTRRLIELDSAFLFELRLLEQMPDCPGVNDPVHLYGTLVGPLTAGGSSGSGPVLRQEGQLTVSRGDILAGLVAGRQWAFRCADAGGKRVARVFSMLIGADRFEAVAAGQGAVLVYPMLGLDGDVYAEAPGNEEIVSRVLYDLLFAWWTDVAREVPPAFRSPDALPVPSRPQHEQLLARAGFKIKGDVAVRTKAGWAGALPGPLGRESRPIPQEAGTDDFLKLAVEALVKAPEWPSPSGSALATRVRTASAAVPTQPSPAQESRPFEFKGAPVPGWMREFMAPRARRASVLTPGPDDPSVPRALPPVSASGEKAADALALLASRFDQADDR